MQSSNRMVDHTERRQYEFLINSHIFYTVFLKIYDLIDRTEKWPIPLAYGMPMVQASWDPANEALIWFAIRIHSRKYHAFYSETIYRMKSSVHIFEYRLKKKEFQHFFLSIFTCYEWRTNKRDRINKSFFFCFIIYCWAIG